LDILQHFSIARVDELAPCDALMYNLPPSNESGAAHSTLYGSPALYFTMHEPMRTAGMPAIDLSARMSSLKRIPTILRGDAGARLWPVSRQLHRKPLIGLADGPSLLQKAWRRGAALQGAAEMLTNRELCFEADDADRAVAGKHALANSDILEPFGRNTAPTCRTIRSITQ
jgi:hypothetical protein